LHAALLFTRRNIEGAMNFSFNAKNLCVSRSEYKLPGRQQRTKKPGGMGSSLVRRSRLSHRRANSVKDEGLHLGERALDERPGRRLVPAAAVGFS
jgi:hypothetical protein